jgi:hypothetical protein
MHIPAPCIGGYCRWATVGLARARYTVARSPLKLRAILVAAAPASCQRSTAWRW